MLYHVTSYQVGNSAFVPVQKNILSSSGSCSVEGSPQTVASPRLQQFAELLRASRAVAIVSACSACADATAESGSKRVLWRMREDGVFFGHLTWKSTIATCIGAYYGILWHIYAYGWYLPFSRYQHRRCGKAFMDEDDPIVTVTNG